MAIQRLRPCHLTRRSSRPLRARDRGYFGVILCSALAPADAQAVSPLYHCQSRRNIRGIPATIPIYRLATGDNLMLALQPLADAGLTLEVCAPDDPYLTGRFTSLYWIAKPTANPKSTHFFGEQSIPIEDVVLNLGYLLPNSRALGDYPFWDWPVQTDAWVLWLWDYLPGPGPTDFVSSCTSLNQAMKIILDFYFGAPTIIDGWVVPLQRHPQLVQSSVREAIQRAVPRTDSAFQALVDEYRQRHPRSTWRDRLWATVFQISFLTIPHQHDPAKTLFLRRDLQEAFMIAAPAG
jgi:hypothetical protein